MPLKSLTSASPAPENCQMCCSFLHILAVVLCHRPSSEFSIPSFKLRISKYPKWKKKKLKNGESLPWGFPFWGILNALIYSWHLRIDVFYLTFLVKRALFCNNLIYQSESANTELPGSRSYILIGSRKEKHIINNKQKLSNVRGWYILW